METKLSKENGADKPSSQSAGSIAQRSRLRRTLLFVGVVALLAMLYVPTPEYNSRGYPNYAGYRFIFDTQDTGVAFFQLLVNVAFAGLLGAILATIVPTIASRLRKVRRVVWVGIVVIVVIALLSFGVVAYSVNVATRYHAFTNQLSAVQDIHIGDSREEVTYRLGVPPHVLGPVEQDWFGLRRVYTVFGADNDRYKVPSATKVGDYDAWLYEEPDSNVSCCAGGYGGRGRWWHRVPQ